MGYIGALKGGTRDVNFWAPCQTIGDLSGAAASRMVLQHASAVAHGTRADHLVARSPASRTGSSEKALEFCGSQHGGVGPRSVSCFRANTKDGEAIERIDHGMGFAIWADPDPLAGLVLQGSFLAAATGIHARCLCRHCNSVVRSHKN